MKDIFVVHRYAQNTSFIQYEIERVFDFDWKRPRDAKGTTWWTLVVVSTRRDAVDPLDRDTSQGIGKIGKRTARSNFENSQN